MRPQIKDFFERDVELITVQKEYAKSNILYNYMNALDRYIDELEDEQSNSATAIVRQGDLPADVLLAEIERHIKRMQSVDCYGDCVLKFYKDGSGEIRTEKRYIEFDDLDECIKLLASKTA